MANKLISDLTYVPAPAISSYIEVQLVGETITKRTDITGILLPEITARQAQDDVIEASCGLDTDGQISTQFDDTFNLTAADFAAGITDTGGATGALTVNLSNALRVLDYWINYLSGIITGAAGELSVIQIELTASQVRNLWTGPSGGAGTGFTILEETTGLTDYFYEVVSAVAFMDFAGVAMDYGTDEMEIFYTGNPTAIIYTWTNAFLETAADRIQYGEVQANCVPIKDVGLSVRSTSADAAADTFTGLCRIWLSYRIHSVTAAGIIPET